MRRFLAIWLMFSSGCAFGTILPMAIHVKNPNGGETGTLYGLTGTFDFKTSPCNEKCDRNYQRGKVVMERLLREAVNEYNADINCPPEGQAVWFRDGWRGERELWLGVCLEKSTAEKILRESPRTTRSKPPPQIYCQNGEVIWESAGPDRGWDVFCQKGSQKELPRLVVARNFNPTAKIASKSR